MNANLTPHASALAELDAMLETADDPALALVEQVIASYAEEDPELAKLIRRAAMVRRLDVEIVGVLCDDSGDEAKNLERLRNLASLTFVVSRQGGGLVYHDNTRDLLLKDWQSEARVEEFQAVNQRLVAHFRVVHQSARAQQREFERMSPLLLRANPGRLAQIAAAVEGALIAPLIEGLYHATLSSSDEGYDFFVDAYQEYEALGRPTICESLLIAYTDFTERSASGQSYALWRRYWRARLLESLRRTAEAREILEQLLASPADDHVLTLWVLSLLGSMCIDEARFREGQQILTRQLGLVSDRDVDRFNLPTIYLQIGQLHRKLWQQEAAAASFRNAITAAAEVKNANKLLQARIGLAATLADSGNWAGAYDILLEGFDETRSDPNPDGLSAVQLAYGLVGLFAGRDAELTHTLMAEHEELTAATNPEMRVSLRQYHATVLLDGGRVGDAERQLWLAGTDPVLQANTALQRNQWYIGALLHAERGEVEKAIDLNTLILNTFSNNLSTYDRAAALTNRAMEYIRLGLLGKAEQDITCVLQEWERVEHPLVLDFIQVIRADLQMRQGGVGEALSALLGVFSHFDNAPARYRAHAAQSIGEAYRLLGDMSRAREHFELALRLFEAAGRPKACAELLTLLAGVAIAQADWAAATQLTDAASRMLGRLEHPHGTTASKGVASLEATELADEENRAGVKALATASPTEREEIRLNARDLFRSAIERVPTNPWYRLNLAYTCIESGEWIEAADALEIVLNDHRTWLRSSVLYRRLLTLRLQGAEMLYRGGEYKRSLLLLRGLDELLTQHASTGEQAAAAVREGDCLVCMRRHRSATKAYSRALATADPRDRASVLGVYARLALLALVNGIPSRSQWYLQTGVAIWHQLKKPSWTRLLLRELDGLARSRGDRHALISSLRGLLDSPALTYRDSSCVRALLRLLSATSQ